MDSAADSEQPNADESTDTTETTDTDVVSETLAIESLATVEPAPTMVVTIPNTYGVNARRGPSTSSLVVQVLTRGTTVTAIGRLANSSWVQVALADDLTAWVFAGAVLYSPSEMETLPIVTP